MVAGEEREAANRRWLRKGLHRPLLPPVLPNTDCKRRERTERGTGYRDIQSCFQGSTITIFPATCRMLPSSALDSDAIPLRKFILNS